MYMILGRLGKPFATGYDKFGDPIGYIYATEDEVREALDEIRSQYVYPERADLTVYKLTRAFGEE